MMLISHRGNINGKLPQRENSPDYIDEAIESGYLVEVDLWCIGDSLYLGHDEPQYETNFEWLQERSNWLWLHCKNREALEFTINNRLHCFWHQDDDYTITSNGYVWAYPGKHQAGKNTILVMPEIDWPVDLIHQLPCFGVCSDFVGQIKA